MPPVPQVPASSSSKITHVAQRDASVRPVRQSYSWAWRTFQHKEGRARWLGGPAGAELSVRWRNLSEEAREPYAQLGQAASDLARSGLKPWPRVRRERKLNLLPHFGGAAEPGAVDLAAGGHPCTLR